MVNCEICNNFGYLLIPYAKKGQTRYDKCLHHCFICDYYDTNTNYCNKHNEKKSFVNMCEEFTRTKEVK